MSLSTIHIGSTYQDIIAGLNTIYSPHQLTNGATPFCQNVDFNRNPGSIAKRRGHVQYSCARETSASSGTSNGYVNGIHQFIDQDQNDTLFAAYVDTDATTQTFTRQVESIEWPGNNTDPFIITVTNHGLVTGDTVYFHGQAPDSYLLAGNTYTVTVTATDTYTLDGTFHSGAITTKTFPQSGYVDHIVETGEQNAIAIVPPPLDDPDAPPLPGYCAWTDVYSGYVPRQIEQVAGVTAPDPNKVYLHIVDHGLITGQLVTIHDLSPDTFSLDGLTFSVTVIDQDNFYLDGAVATATMAYVPTTGFITVGVETVPVGDINFCTFADICIAVGVEIPTIYWYTGIDPNLFTDLTGLPPANGQQIIVFQNSVFIANTSAGSSRIHWCVPSNPFDWTTPGSAGYIDVNPNDGDFITGLAVSAGYLFIYKRHSVYILSGNSPASYTVIANPAFDGCIYGRTIQNEGTFINYLSYRAVLSTAPGAYSTETSVPLKPSLEGETVNGIPGMSLTAKYGAASGRSLYQYWLAFDSDDDGKNDSAFVFDYVTAAWTFYTNINARVFTQLQDLTLIAGASDAIDVYVYQQGEIDYGQKGNVAQAIPMIWKSKQFDSVILSPTQTTDFMDVKTLQNVGIRAPVLEGGNITMDVSVNGADTNDPTVWSLSAAQAAIPSASILVLWNDMLSSQKGNTIQITLSDDTIDSPTVINALTVEMDVDLHLKWGPGPTSTNPPA